MKAISGKKSYIVAIATAAYAILGVVLGYHDFKHAAELILGAGAIGSVRAAIGKV